MKSPSYCYDGDFVHVLQNLVCLFIELITCCPSQTFPSGETRQNNHGLEVQICTSRDEVYKRIMLCGKELLQRN